MANRGVASPDDRSTLSRMQPFERLRYLARWSDEDGPELVSEASDCLAAFDGDPAGLVVACRRLLVHHRASAPLWWLCARVLTAPDAAEAAWEAWHTFREDRTAARLAAALPFPHDEPVAVLGWPDVTASALAERPDLDVLAVRPRGGEDALSRRIRRAAHPVRVVAEPELLALAPTHLLVEPIAAGAREVLAPRGTRDLLAAARDHGAAIWLVAGVGRVLPERLFEAMRDATGDDPAHEVIAAEAVDRVAGPGGLESTLALTRRGDCPVAPELFRLAG